LKQAYYHRGICKLHLGELKGITDLDRVISIIPFNIKMLIPYYYIRLSKMILSTLMPISLEHLSIILLELSQKVLRIAMRL
jgi:hypothetical protein